MSLNGCRVVNLRQHTGLQQLVMLTSAARSFLGPDKRFKFVVEQDSGESALACSPLRLLENVDTSCAAGQLLLETLQAHQKTFRTGTAALMFMVGAWSVAVLQCLHEGIPLRDVVSSMTEGLSLCSEACQMSSVPVREVINIVARAQRWQVNLMPASVHSSEGVLHGSEGASDALLAPFSRWPAHGISRPSCLGERSSRDSRAATSARRNLKLRHSRHFSQFGGTTGTEMEPERSLESSFLLQSNFECQDTDFLASAVSHGSDSLMKLVIEANRIQTENTRCGDFSQSTFDVSKLVTCLLPGFSEDCSCVASGLVTFVSVEQASLIDHLKDRDLHVALISADLSAKYRHLGFNRPSDIRKITESINSLRPSREDRWVTEVSETLLRLKVNVLLVNGVVSEDLTEACFQHNILIIEKVRPEVSKDFAQVTGAILVTYATQLSELCVGVGLQVAFWGDPGGNRSKSHRPVGVKIRARGATLVTAIITSTVQAKLQALEDRFWGCAYRLHHALLDGRLLPGAGVVEMFCVKHLMKASKDHVKDQHDSRAGSMYTPAEPSPYRATILQYMSHGWVDYVSTLRLNTGECSSQLEAWTALRQDMRLWASRSIQPYSFWERLPGQAVVDGQTTVIYDNVTVKLEAWRKALDLVLTVLQTDMELITGISTTNTQEGEGFLLL